MVHFVGQYQRKYIWDDSKLSILFHIQQNKDTSESVSRKQSNILPKAGIDKFFSLKGQIETALDSVGHMDYCQKYWTLPL